MSQPTGRLREIWQDLKPRFSAFGEKSYLSDLKYLFTIRKNPVGLTKLLLFLAGMVATAITMGGILIGYTVGYNKFMRPNGEVPRLTKLPAIVITSMLLGGVLIWGVLAILLALLEAVMGPNLLEGRVILLFIIVNTLVSFFSYFIFRKWRNGVHNLLAQSDQYGSAAWGYPHEMQEHFMYDGVYIGGNMISLPKGHILTFGGTRSRKGTGLIVPNMLRLRNPPGSMVLIDIKGEAAAICKENLMHQGKNVVIINPWKVLEKQLGSGSCFNPLDMIRDKNSIDLTDDIAMIAELIVPIKQQDHNAFFTDSARNVIIGLLLHLVTSVAQPTLIMLWEWARYYGEQWDNLLADMADSRDRVNGHAIRNSAQEILKMADSPETFASIISNVLEATAFLRSGALQKAMVSDFDPYTLAADGQDTVVFVVLPADKLAIMGRYLRLVTTTMLRSVIRRPGKKVTFVIDEAASLGYISEIPVAMAAYAGFNVSMWLVYQDIQQLQDTYGNRWESIIANCHVRQFTGVNDLTTAEYVSKMCGKKTRTVYSKDFMGFVNDVETSERSLATPDEVMRHTKDNMLILIAGHNPVIVKKVPYYHMSELKDEHGKNMYAPNPYEANSL